MASAALWPGAPSSFLVRALWSEGEGKSGAPLARFGAAVHVWREGAAQGCLRAPRGSCGIGGGRPLRAKSGGERRRRTLGRRSAAGCCVLSGARPRDEAGRPGRCAAGVARPQRGGAREARRAEGGKTRAGGGAPRPQRAGPRLSRRCS